MEDSLPCIPLPRPHISGLYSVEEALQRRRSVRSFGGAPLTIEELGQLLWAAQGDNNADGLRTAPSAGALYPLELYIAVAAVTGLASGVYRYVPGRHQLAVWQRGSVRDVLTRAAFDQESVEQAPVVIVIGAVARRTERAYGARGARYVHLEAGHAAENLFLQAEALGLETVVLGAFQDAAMARALNLPQDTAPLVLMPVGRPRYS